MGFQKVEYSFPHENDEEESTEIEVEGSSAEVIDINGAKGVKADTAMQVDVTDEDDIKIEIINDTPENDRYRKDVVPEELTEEDLNKYEGEVKEKLSSFRKGYHTERRAKESAERERQEMERITKQLYDENMRLRGDVNKSQQALYEEAKAKALREVASAKFAYKRAYENGDATKLLDAQEKLTTAKLNQQKLADSAPEALQNAEDVVQRSNNQAPPPEVNIDERAARWQQENDWFNRDVEMTGYALGLHNKLVNEGVDPTSDQYYNTIDTRMRELFPENFNDGTAPRKKKGNVVAPATRSTAPKKVRLTKTQVALSKRLGITPEQYARQIAIDMRKQANG